MSSGGGKKETVTQTQQSGPPQWAIPYYQSAINAAGNIASQPYQGYDGPRVAGFNSDQMQGMAQTRTLANQGAPGVASANKYVGGVIGGTQGVNPYSGKNPYLDKMIGSAQKDVTDSFNRNTVPQALAQFNAGGAYGGTAMMDSLSQSQRNLGDQLSDISTTLRSDDYNRQVGLAESNIDRRMQAAGMAPGLNEASYYGANRLQQQGAVQQNLMQSLLDSDYGDFTEQRDWGANRLGVLTNALGAIQGGTTQNTSSQANPNYRSAGQNAASYAAILASLYG